MFPLLAVDRCRKPEGLLRKPPVTEADIGARGIGLPDDIASVVIPSDACVLDAVEDLDLGASNGPVDLDRKPESDRGRLCFFTIPNAGSAVERRGTASLENCLASISFPCSGHVTLVVSEISVLAKITDFFRSGVGFVLLLPLKSIDIRLLRPASKRVPLIDPVGGTPGQDSPEFKRS